MSHCRALPAERLPREVTEWSTTRVVEITSGELFTAGELRRVGVRHLTQCGVMARVENELLVVSPSRHIFWIDVRRCTRLRASRHILHLVLDWDTSIDALPPPELIRAGRLDLNRPLRDLGWAEVSARTPVPPHICGPLPAVGAVVPAHVPLPPQSYLELTQEATEAYRDDPTVTDAQARVEWALQQTGVYRSTRPSPIPMPTMFIVGPDWVGDHYENWVFLGQSAVVPIHRMLEIGAWEGRTAYTLSRMFHRTLWSYEAVDLGATCRSPGLIGRLRNLHALSMAGGFDVHYGPSAFVLPELARRNHRLGRTYDWIYIDGSHMADDVLLDSEYAWMMLSVGGYIIWDDVNSWWCEFDSWQGLSPHTPLRGVSAFLHLHRGEWEEVQLPCPSVQRVIRRTAARWPRVGTVADPLVFGGGVGANQAIVPDSLPLRVGPLPLPLLPGSMDAMQWMSNRSALASLGQALQAPNVVPQAISSIVGASLEASTMGLQQGVDLAHQVATVDAHRGGTALGGLIGTVAVVGDAAVGTIGFVSAVWRRGRQWVWGQ